MICERDREMANDVLNRSGEEQADLDLVEIIAAALAQARAEGAKRCEDAVAKLVAIVRAEEREACAKICDSLIGDSDGSAFEDGRSTARDQCAAAIRARGEK